MILIDTHVVVWLALSNIMLAKSSAKLKQDLASNVQLSQYPAEHGPLTAEGMIFGRLQYMATEQLEGKKEVDVRTDVFAFGAVVFDIAMGKRAFEAKSQAS
jgi:serine/threonine protein kinase